MTDSLSQFWWT